jgi:hypothetical protein
MISFYIAINSNKYPTMSMIQSVISTITSSPIALGASIGITVMILDTYRTYTNINWSSKYTEIRLKEIDTTTKPYSIVDQNNNRYLIDKKVLENIVPFCKIRMDDRFTITYNPTYNKIVDIKQEINWWKKCKEEEEPLVPIRA